VIGFGQVTRDLTDRVRMEQARLELARIEQAERTKDEFLAIMGHELRNPLAPMITAVHLIKLRGGRNSERAIQILERQLEHMMRLVDDLLDVSRARHGKVRLVSGPIEIGEVLANAVDVASALIESKRHRLILDVPATGLVVDVDAARMAQVFGNLLNNAAKYSDPGAEIEVRARMEGEKVLVTIADTGIGISPALMPRLFELFSQGAQGLERQLGGLGIGLAIAHRLVHAHGGEIEAQSAGTGRGSCFTVRLPRSATKAPSQESQAPAAIERQPARRRVLIVDDNEDSSEMVQSVAPGGVGSPDADRARWPARARARGGDHARHHLPRHRSAGNGRLRSGAAPAQDPVVRGCPDHGAERLRERRGPTEGPGGRLHGAFREAGGLDCSGARRRIG
jgi:nitrogen-specific signal transduction histidine kinase